MFICCVYVGLLNQVFLGQGTVVDLERDESWKKHSGVFFPAGMKQPPNEYMRMPQAEALLLSLGIPLIETHTYK